jgi:4-carboxymuconolactone decarboxylase
MIERPTGSQQRFSGPVKDEMSADMTEIYEEIEKSRPGTGIKGPFGPWLASPGFCGAAQNLGRVCRYELMHLTKMESELAIMVGAIHYKASTEWEIHYPEAIKAGISEQILEQIEAGDIDSDAIFDYNTREECIMSFTQHCLIDSENLPDDLYDRCKEQLGDAGLVELVGITGYYALVAMTLNVFKIKP